jgi:hypothetical protein
MSKIVTAAEIRAAHKIKMDDGSWRLRILNDDGLDCWYHPTPVGFILVLDEDGYDLERQFKEMLS